MMINEPITFELIKSVLLNNFQSYLQVDDETSRRMWWNSLEVIQKDFLSNNYSDGGLWVASPLPAINEKKFIKAMKGWLWAPNGFSRFDFEKTKFLPYHQSRNGSEDFNYSNNYEILELNSNEGYDPFLLIITSKFQCVLTITGEKNKKNLIMRNDENSLKKVIELVDFKLSQENIKASIEFKNHLHELGELSFNNDFTNNFWPILSSRLANIVPNINFKAPNKEEMNETIHISEAKLLEAISHEVRTPLATIKTLISSTLKKYNMDEKIKSRLIQIDNECTEQIDRFGLIFNAAELVRGDPSPPQSLASINLGEILKNLSPYWEAQLERRGISLKIDIPNELPEILSNSEKIELMLGGLIDKNTRGIKEGSTLILELRPAGQKVKLQLYVQKENSDVKEKTYKADGSDLGPVLNWNPQTGSLQISQAATQKLLASLGGHVTQRRDTGLTVFFPISNLN